MILIESIKDGKAGAFPHLVKGQVSIMDDDKVTEFYTGKYQSSYSNDTAHSWTVWGHQDFGMGF